MGIKTVVASSSPYAPGELVVASSDRGLLDLVLSGDEVSRENRHRTSTTLLRRSWPCARVLSLIEDAPNGVRAAKAAGMRCLRDYDRCQQDRPRPLPIRS